MAGFSTEKVFGMTIRESANDGSDFTNPDADYRRLFLGEDGLFHLKDSAGTVTTPAFANPMTTAGDVIYGGASGTPTRLAIGTAGQVLKVNAGATAPEWGAAAGGSGALVFLEAHTASNSSSLDFTSFISSTYDTYKIEVVELVPGTNTASLVVSIGTGGGPTYDSGNNYEWAASGRTTGGAAYAINGSSGVAALFTTMSSDAGYGFGTASLTATGLQSTALRKTIQGTIQYVTSTGPASQFAVWGMQWITTGTAVTALRFSMTSGNITSGTIRIYGVVKA